MLAEKPTIHHDTFHCRVGLQTNEVNLLELTKFLKRIKVKVSTAIVEVEHHEGHFPDNGDTNHPCHIELMIYFPVANCPVCRKKLAK